MLKASTHQNSKENISYIIKFWVTLRLELFILGLSLNNSRDFHFWTGGGRGRGIVFFMLGLDQMIISFDIEVGVCF